MQLFSCQGINLVTTERSQLELAKDYPTTKGRTHLVDTRHTKFGFFTSCLFSYSMKCNREINLGLQTKTLPGPCESTAFCRNTTYTCTEIDNKRSIYEQGATWPYFLSPTRAMEIQTH